MILIETIFLFLIVGVLAGFMAGLLGIGGGLVVVPMLALLLPLYGIPDAQLMQIVIGTSLTIIALSSLSLAHAHYIKGRVNFYVVRHFLGGLILGAITGVVIANLLPSDWLKRLFGIFVLYLGWNTFRSKENDDKKELPKPLYLFFSATIISTLCAMLGMGGGALIVPFLLHYSLPVHAAIATSAVCTFPVAFSSAIMFFVLGLNNDLQIAGLTSNIYWPAVIGIAATSIPVGRLGTHFAHRIPASVLRKIFGIFLFVVALSMLLS